MWWPWRKHLYFNTGVQPMPDGAPRWFDYKCCYCEDVTGLTAWQLREMPTDMARCPKGQAISPFELLRSLLSGCVNCLAQTREGPLSQHSKIA